jgi:hypothetical protein
MQVSCGNCQLSFDAPEGASGLVCPICRGPLLPKSADGADAAAGAKAVQEWSGGDLDDLIAILSGPAVSARVEVLGASGDAAVGEVHLLAGGVSDALFGGKSTDDALDKLRAAKPTRFRVEQRLPNPADGDLTYPGPESGTLESRALAHLMRYCEDYVISCQIEVWRGNENARVEYKRGEIGTVTVGGIDAPERLAEVMQWASGNYRLVVPPLKLPPVAPKRPQAAAAAPAKVPAPAPSAQAARSASATKTIFGMPAAEIIKARAAAEAAKAAAAASGGSGPIKTPSPVSTTTPAPAPSPAPAAAPPIAASAAPTPAPAKVAPPGVAPSQTPAPIARSTGGSATKTIFGVPAPGTPGGYTPVTQPSPAAAPTPAPAPVAAAPVAPTVASGSIDDRSKTGARKVSVPAPEVSVAPAAAADDPAATRSGYSAPAAEAPKRPSAPVAAPTPRPAPAPAPIAAAASEKTQATKRETPIWTYVGVGVLFGAGMIGIYQLVGLLTH